MFKSFSESHEFSHCFTLELLNIFVLLLKLTVCGVLESAELQRLISALVINLLL